MGTANKAPSKEVLVERILSSFDVIPEARRYIGAHKALLKLTREDLVHIEDMFVWGKRK